MSSNLSELDRFRQAVLADLGLQRQLQYLSDNERFLELLLRLGRERGYGFTRLDVEEALRAARRTWIERWID